jgi:HAD superfamily hydrolase (TIGR01549 family)
VSFHPPQLALRAVTFDVGSTLLFQRERAASKRARRELRAWLRNRGARVDRQRLRRLLAQAVAACPSQAGEREVVAAATERLLAALELRATGRDRAELRSRLHALWLAPGEIAADGAIEALAALTDEGIRLGIVSNRSWRPGRLTWRRLQATGLAEFFEPSAIAWSDEVGVRKPHREIFLASLRALGESPQQAAHVGDSTAKDVAGARRLGMTAIRYAGVRDDTRDGPPASAVIHHFAALPDVLGLPGGAAFAA